MFGVVQPSIPLLSPEERSRFSASYCNLCASLGFEYGVTSRFLVVHDIATLGWLFEGDTRTSQPFAAYNCLKGGTLGRRRDQPLPLRNRFLAAISAYAIGVKVKDDLQDRGSLTARASEWLFGPTFEQSKATLAETGFDVASLETTIKAQQQVEQSAERKLDVASEPTAAAYAQVSEYCSATAGEFVSSNTARAMGAAIGRCVYLLDAYRDYAQDIGRSFNPLLEVGTKGRKLSPAGEGNLRQYIAAQLRDASGLVAETSDRIRSCWASVCDHFARSFGIPAKSVTLYSTCCCVPEARTVVVFNGDECGKSCTTSCCGAICLTGCCCYAIGCRCGC
jgi:hypothetical protein